MFVFKLDDVFVHRLDFIRVLSQPNDFCSTSIQRDNIPNLMSCHLCRPALHGAGQTNALSLSFLDENRLVTHSLSVQHSERFRNLAIVL